jgi:2,4-dienoyl-CoA reductase-like NADH-dependent reductase (Old Yellow Enzyme family)
VLQPVTVGSFHLKNRIAMAPLTRSRSNEGAFRPSTDLRDRTGYSSRLHLDAQDQTDVLSKQA